MQGNNYTVQARIQRAVEQRRLVWVRSGTRRDDYFITTDAALSAEALVETFTGRWSIEVTFEELRAYLRLGDHALLVQELVAVRTCAAGPILLLIPHDYS